MRQINLVCREDRINRSKDLQITFPSIKLKYSQFKKKKFPRSTCIGSLVKLQEYSF